MFFELYIFLACLFAASITGYWSVRFFLRHTSDIEGKLSSLRRPASLIRTTLPALALVTILAMISFEISFASFLPVIVRRLLVGALALLLITAILLPWLTLAHSEGRQRALASTEAKILRALFASILVVAAVIMKTAIFIVRAAAKSPSPRYTNPRPWDIHGYETHAERHRRITGG